MSRLKWLLTIFLRYYRNLGLRVSLYALLSLLTATLSPLTNAFLPSGITARLDFSSVMPVLTILASSMLAVSTFSLNIMVSAHRAAAETTTPRVHRILLEDTTTQSVLATFIGAFVYSLGSIILYRAGFYPEEAAVVVMGVTILVVVLVVISILRWIEHLTELGSVDDSLRSAAGRASETLSSLARHPRFGAEALSEETVLPASLTEVRARQSGFLQLIDVARLHDLLSEAGCIYVEVEIGSHVLDGQVIARVSGSVTDDKLEDLAKSFTIGSRRTQEQDAKFGLIVLSEIASKALSPGVNDPGTAIEAILLSTSLLWDCSRQEPDPDAFTSSNVFVRFPDQADLVTAAFAPIARDGADKIEVAVHLRRSLAALARSDERHLVEAASNMADYAFAYSEAAGLPESEMDQLRRITVPENG
ncbi:MAG: DUF2254 domain-containing protein [Pseudomonadota bacterium]